MISNLENLYEKVLQLIIPSDMHEEVLGDLYELDAKLKEKGKGKISILLTVLSRAFSIGFFTRFIRIIFCLKTLEKARISSRLKSRSNSYSSLKNRSNLRKITSCYYNEKDEDNFSNYDSDYVINLTKGVKVNKTRQTYLIKEVPKRITLPDALIDAFPTTAS